MSELVSARVPAEIRHQGNRLLKEIGSSPTELVNAAYRYLIEVGRLPQREQPPVSDQAGHGQPTVRQLDPDAARTLAASIERTTLPISAPNWETKSYKDIIAQGRLADYEALS